VTSGNLGIDPGPATSGPSCQPWAEMTDVRLSTGSDEGGSCGPRVLQTCDRSRLATLEPTALEVAR
jgi:hypothetical protein